MFFKGLQGVKDRWARNKCGRSFHSLAPSLAETLAKCLNSPELQFPYPYDKNNQPCPADLTRLGQESEGQEWALATIKCSQNSHQHCDEKKMWLILLYFPRKSAWSSDPFPKDQRGNWEWSSPRASTLKRVCACHGFWNRDPVLLVVWHRVTVQ